MNKDFHYFSSREYAFQKKFQGFRDRLLRLVAKALTFFRITPSMVTFTSFASILFFAYFCLSKPWLALLLLVLHVVLDGVDGVLARATGKVGPAGALLDMLNDHTGFVVVIISLVFYALLDPVLGLVYLYLYTLLVFFLIYRNAALIPSTLTLRTKYFLYLVYALWALMGVDIFFVAVLLFTVLTAVSLLENIFKVYFHLSK